jgi:hypothetical protein
MASSPAEAEAEAGAPEAAEKGKRGGGVLGRLWRALFGGREDFEKRLQYLSKEEAAVHARMRRRTQFSRRAVRNLIVLSVLAEVCTRFPSPPAPLVFVFPFPPPPDLRWSADAAGGFARLWIWRVVRFVIGDAEESLLIV